MKRDIVSNRIQATTLREISEKTGCAVSTVSAILNRSPHCYAGAQVREKVLKAARQLDYYPNLLYRSLRSQKTRTIGIIAPNLNVQVAVANIEIIESVAWDNKYHVFIGYSQNNVEKEEALLKDFVGRRVDGIILMVGPEGKQRPVLQSLVAQGFPLVTVGRLPSVPMACVSTDYQAGGRLAAEHLAALGHTRATVVTMEGDCRYPTTVDRVKGFVDAAQDLGLCVEIVTFPSRQTLEDMVLDGYKVGRKLCVREVALTAVFAGNDEIALGVARGLLDAGKRIPADVSLVGFDDSLSAMYAPVPLTTVRQAKEKIAHRAFAILLDQIAQSHDANTVESIMPELKVRSSTGPVPVDQHTR